MKIYNFSQLKNLRLYNSAPSGKNCFGGLRTSNNAAITTALPAGHRSIPDLGKRRHRARGMRSHSFGFQCRHSQLVKTRRHCSFWQEFFEDGRDVLEAEEVAVFVIPFRPLGPMIDLNTIRQRHRLAEINHPNIDLAPMIVHEEERAANQLKEGGNCCLMHCQKERLKVEFNVKRQNTITLRACLRPLTSPR